MSKILFHMDSLVSKTVTPSPAICILVNETDSAYSFEQTLPPPRKKSYTYEPTSKISASCPQRERREGQLQNACFQCSSEAATACETGSKMSEWKEKPVHRPRVDRVVLSA